MTKNILLLLACFLVACHSTSTAQVADVMQYGLKADFQRVVVSLQGTTVTAAGYQFTAGDVGKVMAIKKARLYARYTALPLTLNAIITQVKSGRAIIESPHQGQAINVQNTEAIMGTNNFDAIQKALDDCFAKGKKQLLLNYTGTAYVVPFFSDLCKSHGRNDAGNTSGFIVRGNIEIKGLGNTKTKIKTGAEDIVYLSPEEEFKFDLFYLDAVPNGPVESKVFRDFTIIGADRATPAARSRNAVCRTNYKDFQVMNILWERVDIDGKTGFDEGFGTSRGGRWNANGTVKDFCQYTIRNCNWSSYCTLSVFSQVPAVNANAINGSKKVLVENSIFNGGGIPTMQTYTDAATINGKTLSITTPGFSFYNFNSYIAEFERKPLVTLEDAVDATITKLVNNYENTKDLEIDKTINITADYFDIYITDAKNNITPIIQAGHSTAGTNKLYLVTAIDGSLFKPGNKIRLVLKKLQCNVMEIVSPNVARIEWKTGSAASLNNVTAVVNDGHPSEGHTMYIHPNVSCRFVNLTIKNSQHLSLHHYSGGGVLGNRLYFEMDGVKVLPGSLDATEGKTGLVAPVEFTMENSAAGTPIILKNSTLLLYQTQAWLKATNCKLLGGQCDGGIFENCTGAFDIWGAYPTSFTNCNFENYSAIRPREPGKLSVTSVNSNFGFLNLVDLQSFTMSGGKIETLLLSPKLKAAETKLIKMKGVQIKSRQ